MFIKEIFDNKSPDDFDEETLTTINKFFENSLNVSETSRQLYIHRKDVYKRQPERHKAAAGRENLGAYVTRICRKMAQIVEKTCRKRKYCVKSAEYYKI